VKTPIASGKFLKLKSLEIIVSSPNFSPDYDFCSLVSFVDASPALESLIVRVSNHFSDKLCVLETNLASILAK